MKKIITLLVIIFTIFPVCSFAFVVEESLASPQDEERARQIFTQLRCIVCVGQSVASSDVELARDVRHFVRSQIKQGASNEQIISYLTERYGREILLSTPKSIATIPLWTLPFALLFMLGAIVGWRYMKRV